MINAKTESFLLPASTKRIGGITKPSWSNSFATGIDPGAMPPISAWCARVATNPII